MDPEEAEVKAAGCVAWRENPDGEVEIAVVHRPHYDDWSLPKGKLDPGEDSETAAIRELEEETGLAGELGAELAPVTYVDHKDRTKAVRYWLLEVAPDAPPFVVNDEVDELAWCELADAAARVSYPTDARVIADATARLASGVRRPTG